MALRRLLGGLACAALLTVAACGKDKEDTNKQQAAGGAGELEKRCDQLAKTCGDKEKHVAKIVEECKIAAQVQASKKCVSQAMAEYDCYEKQLCGGADKVWTISDLEKLADRRSKCVAERDATRNCVVKQ